MIDDAINVAVIGAGYWGPNLIRNFNEIQDCRIACVCDLKSGRRQYIKERFPGILIIDDLDEVLTREEVDAVVVATPVSTHREIALAALQAGKHVWVEKPLADSVLGAREITTEAKAKGLVLATDHLFVHNPAIVKSKEIVSSGEIGEMCYAESSRVNLGPPDSEVNVIWDLATHDLSITYYLWERKPVEVVAYGYRYQHPELIDVAFLHLHFENGSAAIHHVSWLCPEKTRRYFWAGERGSLLFDDTQEDKKLRLIDQGVDSRIGAKDDEVKELFYKPGSHMIVLFLLLLGNLLIQEVELYCHF